METNNKYYNAKPSKIANIGADVSGAKRMYFDTYETDAEREAKAKRKAIDNGLKVIKAAIKAEVLSEAPDRGKLVELLSKQFELSYGFDGLAEGAYLITSKMREEAISPDAVAEFNKMIRARNSLRTDMRYLNSGYSFKYFIQKMRTRYQPKESFIEQSGAVFNWKEFTFQGSDLLGKVEYLAVNSKAVQFGNSVTDKERGHILIQLVEFLESWKGDSVLSKIDLMPVSWSFGARGNPQSVAYYQPGLKLISVNRNNIGSLIHELGHYIDDIKGKVSNKISYETIYKYRDSIKDKVSGNALKYYCKREEIFARAFEAYCYEMQAGFSAFAQCGDDFLPELNDNLRAILKEALQA